MTLEQKVKDKVKDYFSENFLQNLTKEEVETISQTFLSIILSTRSLADAIKIGDDNEIVFQTGRLRKLNNIVENYKVCAKIENSTIAVNFVAYFVGNFLGKVLKEALLSLVKNPDELLERSK
jgi:hypothetical protein